MKGVNRIYLGVAILCFFAFSLSSVGVFGKWIYYPDAQPLEYPVYHSLGVFDYTPEEILPGGDNEEATLGGDHYTLIDLVLNEIDKGYGLNAGNTSILHQYLIKQPVVYSNQKITGGNLKFILDPKNNTHDLYYCLEKISDTEYYAYTFSSAALSSAAENGSEILVYKTILEKTDKWRATKSYIGYAKARGLKFLGVSPDPNTIPYSVDVSTWRYSS